MKSLRSLLLFTCLFTISGSFVSCKKTQVGPAGPQGNTGATGPAGANGNANVRSFVFSTSNWRPDSACKSFSYKYHVADLNSSVLESGAIILYLGSNTGDNQNQWSPMPLISDNLRFTFDVELSTIQIYVSTTNGTMPKDPGTQKFKLVLIPPAS